MPGLQVPPLPDVLSRLHPDHRRALDWFIAVAGTEQSWTPQLPGGIQLVSTPKGIYKPKGLDYALSVRQTLGGVYPDRDPVFRPDGTWTYLYHQEGDSLEELESLFTNRGLIACSRDVVPVGVMRQTRRKPDVRYQVLGCAVVAGWKDGYFHLEGFSPEGVCIPVQLDGPRGDELADLAQKISVGGFFDPSGVTDARDRVLRSLAQRRGQPEFRRQLLRIYGCRCAISGCTVGAALEAAHVTPYMGAETNTPQNGILLRCDIHTLWDLGLIGIEEATGRIVINRALEGTEYERFAGAKAMLPASPTSRPSAPALKTHRENSGLAPPQ